LLADRLWNDDRGVPTADSLTGTSATIELSGGYSGRLGANSFMFDADHGMDDLLGDYHYGVSYFFLENGDLRVIASTYDLNNYTYGAGPYWQGSVTLKDYEPGDFGLTFISDNSSWDLYEERISLDEYYTLLDAKAKTFVRNAVESDFINDDSTESWTWDELPYEGPEDVSDAEIAEDLARLLEEFGEPAIPDDALTGGEGPDRIIGTERDDVLKGGGGDDYIISGKGKDLLIFNADSGNDTIADFESGADRLQLPTSKFIDFAAVSAALRQVGSDTVIQIDPYNAIALSNVALNDLDASDSIFAPAEPGIRLEGTVAHEKILGDNRNEIIIGAGGDDLLKGGGGDDIFVFGPGFGHDTILDFVAGPSSSDVIEFSSSVFASFEAVRAAMTTINGGTLITLDQANAIALTTTPLSMLDAGDFRFV
ncbi:MAG: hypothetical protein ABWZ80_01040, partial [Beijerinckiaceae bacterium]